MTAQEEMQGELRARLVGKTIAEVDLGADGAYGSAGFAFLIVTTTDGATFKLGTRDGESFSASFIVDDDTSEHDYSREPDPFQ